MLFKKMYFMLCALLVSGIAFAAGESPLNIRVAKPGATVTIDRVISTGRVLVSVEDAGKNPLFGLNAADISVEQGGKKANVTSLQLIAES